MLVSHLPSDAVAECVHITHRLSARVCRANELASSFLSVWEQNLFSPKRSGKRGHAACRCLYPWLPIYTASDTTKLRDDTLLTVKNRKKSTLRYYIQLTSRACSARSSLAASLPSAVSVDWVFKKKKRWHSWGEHQSTDNYRPRQLSGLYLPCEKKHAP